MQVPKIEKICLNQGVGSAVSDKKQVENAVEEMTAIAGQKALPVTSRKDVSNFKLRKGMPIGVKVTLRGDKMYEFLDRLISVALPRTRDFKGVSAKGFDGRGNFTFGIQEQIPDSSPHSYRKDLILVEGFHLQGYPQLELIDHLFFYLRLLWGPQGASKIQIIN